MRQTRILAAERQGKHVKVIDLEDEDEPPVMEDSDDEEEPPKPRAVADLYSGGQVQRSAFDKRWGQKDTKRQIMSAAVQGSPTQVVNLFTAVGELHALETPEPEYYEVECTLDTGATVHVADRLDFPGHSVLDSEGSLAGQNFQAAGGKLIANEGEMTVHMIAPGGEAGELHSCFQVAKVTRPLLSVTRMTASGKLSVLCLQNEAQVLNEDKKVVATFKRNGGLYTCVMKVKNPRFQPFARPAR